jgi:hypothetical protein
MGSDNHLGIDELKLLKDMIRRKTLLKSYSRITSDLKITQYAASVEALSAVFSVQSLMRNDPRWTKRFIIV